MKDEPAFKPLQGNPAFFQIRAFRCPFHLREKTQGPSHIPIAEGKLFLRCLWKVALHLQSKTGNQLSSWDHMLCTELSSSCCTEIDVSLDLKRVSQESLEFPKERQATYCVWCGTRDVFGASAEEMCFIVSLLGVHQDIFAFLRLHHCSSRLLTALLGTLWSSIKQIEAPYVFGNMELLCMQCRWIGPHLVERGTSHGFSRIATGTWGIFRSYSGDIH